MYQLSVLVLLPHSVGRTSPNHVRLGKKVNIGSTISILVGQTTTVTVNNNTMGILGTYTGSIYDDFMVPNDTVALQPGAIQTSATATVHPISLSVCKSNAWMSWY